MLASLVGGIFLAAALGAAQEGPTSTLQVVTGSATATASVTASATGAPCAQISSLQASFSSAHPSATLAPRFPAELAYECHISVPVVEEDAIKLIDALSAMLEFQSTADVLKNPPAEYPLAGVDLLQEMSNLRSQVQAGVFKNEFDFEANLTRILAEAHDGHLDFIIDGLSVFSYAATFGPLVSVSNDGIAAPSIYLYEDVINYVNGTGGAPSAITAINGIDAAEYTFTTLANNTLVGLSQDPDTIYNQFFYTYNPGAGLGPGRGFFGGGARFGYYGPTTSLTFANGTHTERSNVATTRSDFTDVVDGSSFYSAFINVTNKAAAASSASTSATATSTSSTPAATRIIGYPKPVVISTDGALSGYFFEDPGFEDMAVLALRSMSEGAVESFQSTLTKFLDACRAQNKKNLVIDVTGNGGGTIALGYDTFKQLFPTLEPYGAGNYRAHEGYELLGRAITNFSTTVMQEQPNNSTAFNLADGYTDYAAETFLNDSNSHFKSFDELYGPVEAADGRGDYTNLVRYDLANMQFEEYLGNGIIISGYGNESDIAPQPFKSENIILLSNGNCGSTCTILAHFLKWQGKVKSIAMGGRPHSGPMQAIGGVKGSQVVYFEPLYSVVSDFFSFADNATIAEATNSSLQTISDLGEYLALRSNSAGQDPTEISFNGKNNIAEGDSSYTPLQFVYEAADCHLWYTPQHYYNVATVWATAATQAFGLNGTTPWSMCVQGSTNQPSSLSGNATLYNNGVATNVTSYIPENSNGNSSGNSTPNPYPGAGGRLQASSGLGIFAALFAFALCL